MAKNRLPDFKAKFSRHAHDISAGYTSSMTTGQIIPQYFDVLGPGDSIYFEPSMFLRLRDVVTAFLGEIEVNLDAFFVPMQMMYTPFGQVFAQTNDFLSSMFEDIGSTDKFPVIDGIRVKNHFTDLNEERFGEQTIKSTFRLFDALDANPLQMFASNNLGANDGYPDIAPWLFCAYQAIYQHHFRNDDIERLDINAYQLDKFYNSRVDNYNVFYLRQVQRKDDYFTSVRVSPISSAVNMIQDGSPETGSSIYPVDGGTFESQLFRINDYLGFNNSHGGYNIPNYLQQGASSGYGIGYNPQDYYPSVQSGNPNFESSSDAFGATTIGQDSDFYPTANNIRALFAVDKFMRIYGRANKTYDDQMLAHFGVKIPHDVKHDITHLGHWRTKLMVDPVYSSSTSDGGSVLGQVGGQGSASLNVPKKKFTAPVHGVFMIVAYARTKPKYVGTTSRLNMLTDRLCFPIPEFDKLGAQPLYAYEVYPFSAQFFNTGGSDDRFVWDYTRIGWTNRYMEFKKKYNRVSVAYATPKDVRESSVMSNVWSPWVLSRNPFQNSKPYWQDREEPIDNVSGFVPAWTLFELPNALNNVMAVPYTGSLPANWFNAPWLLFASDPILSEFYCKCKKVSWMSETGEPDL